jgi:hypothetical protein
LRLVNSGVAIVTQNNLKKVTRAFLLEEYIDSPTSGDFVKYIHNAKATPMIGPEEPDRYHKALFLCCVQHIQYVYTYGLAFMSDFQGMRFHSFLTP